MNFLLPYYTNVNDSSHPFDIRHFVTEVRHGEVDKFFLRLKGLFVDYPYRSILGRHPDINLEIHYQNVLFLVFRLLGFYTQVEYQMNIGQADLVLKTDKLIYVMEFKLNDTAESALRQIEEKQYARAFESDGRRVIKVGVGFSKKLRNIEKYVVG